MKVHELLVQINKELKKFEGQIYTTTKLDYDLKRMLSGKFLEYCIDYFSSEIFTYNEYGFVKLFKMKIQWEQIKKYKTKTEGKVTTIFVSCEDEGNLILELNEVHDNFKIKKLEKNKEVLNKNIEELQKKINEAYIEREHICNDIKDIKMSKIVNLFDIDFRNEIKEFFCNGMNNRINLIITIIFHFRKLGVSDDVILQKLKEIDFDNDDYKKYSTNRKIKK